MKYQKPSKIGYIGIALYLTVSPALTGTTRTHGGRPFGTKFGQYGGYTPRIYPKTKIPPAGPEGGPPGPFKFCSMEKLKCPFEP